MVFSSVFFLFIFLPLTLFINYLIIKELRNFFLLLVSLFFYAWGENILVLLMLFSISINYIVGLLITSSYKRFPQNITKFIFIVGLLINLSLLIYYKYIHFLLENLGYIGIEINRDFSNVTLPLGISFFTFQSISYLFDVYRKNVESQKNVIHLGLYIALFPQLIAGPIVRYIDICNEIKNRVITNRLFIKGIERFIRGLSKKVIIANNVGFIADKVFNTPVNELSSMTSWVGVICYALQIYFDFSGYSDMAIGLGKMFGFNFKENFNYPYISKSIQEFWRRWHISLSTWFRDYLYIPLGGNRKGNIRTYINLIIVFFITGLWHGASWNFVIWSLFHGLFLLLEKIIKSKITPTFFFLKRVYVLLVVLISWVLFRSEDLTYAFAFIIKMFSFSTGTNNYPLLYFNIYYFTIIIIGIILSTPIRKMVFNYFKKYQYFLYLINPLKYITYIFIFIISILELAQSTYNPFIYFRF